MSRTTSWLNKHIPATADCLVGNIFFRENRLLPLALSIIPYCTVCPLCAVSTCRRHTEDSSNQWLLQTYGSLPVFVSSAALMSCGMEGRHGKFLMFTTCKRCYVRIMRRSWQCADPRSAGTLLSLCSYTAPRLCSSLCFFLSEVDFKTATAGLITWSMDLKQRGDLTF